MKDWDYLKKLSKMESQEDIQEFERRVWDLAETQDPKRLKQLIDLFDDNCLYPEVMYSLVHAIETYPDEVYVKAILNKMVDGVALYPYWIRNLVYRILNEENCKKTFQTYMHLSSKDSLLKLFDLMEEESSSHREVINELRNQLLKIDK